MGHYICVDGNQSAKMGVTGSSFLDRWVLCPYSVDDFWSSLYCTIIRTKQGELYYSGTNSVFGISSSVSTWTRCESYFGFISPSSIKDIKITSSTGTNNSMLILTSDGQLYGIGMNGASELGTATAPITSPLLIDTSVSAIASSEMSRNFHYIKDGIYYRCGENTFYQLGTGDNKPITSFTALNLGSSHVIAVQATRWVTRLIVQSSTSALSLMAAGWNTQLTIGGSENTGIIRSSFTTNPYTDITANSFDKLSPVSYVNAIKSSTNIINTNGKGYNSNGAGLGRNAFSGNYGSILPIEFFDDSVDLSHVEWFGTIGNGSVSVVSIGEDLYWTGNPGYFTEQGETGYIYKFKKCVPFR